MSVRARVEMRARSIVNPTIRTLLRSPIHRLVSGKLLVITVVGRGSGRRYSIPVAYAESNGCLLVGTSARWHRNLQGVEPVLVHLRDRAVFADTEIITDADEMTELYAAILVGNPAHARNAGIHPTSEGSVNRDEVSRAAARGEVIIRLRPRTGVPRPTGI
jgi:hypothetical protein